MQNLFELLKAANQNKSNKTAIYWNQKEYSYSEYYQNTLKIANGLKKLPLSDTKPILVIIDERPEDLFTFLAIMALGHFYVPVGAGLPKDRLDSMLQTFQIEHILSTLTLDIPGVISITKLMEENEALEIREIPYLKSKPAFGMFTSGSTGVPKLVLKSHRSILEMCESFVKVFHFTEEDVYGNQVSFEFDSSLKSIFLSLYQGAAISLIPQKHFMFPKLVMDTINQTNVNRLIWSTFGLKLLERFQIFKTEHIPKVKTVLFSGEPMPIKTIRYWLEHLAADYYNVYAPTEVSFNCSYYPVKADNLDNWERLPIGKPISGNQILIIKENGEEAKAGESGEIYVLGCGLAMGYYNNPERTAESFVQNPLQSCYPETAYRTGDQGYFDEEGNLHFMGRLDYQIKHLGYRIELGEIEDAVMQLSEVKNCACLYKKEEQKIIAFVEGNLEEKAVFDYLSEKLPRYMLPKQIIFKETFPLNRNNKIDRKELEKEI